MEEHGAPSQFCPVEEKYPDQAAEYILQTAEEPTKPRTWRAEDSKLPLNAARALDRKLQQKYSGEMEQIRPLATEALERRLTRRLDIVDRYLDEETLLSKLSESRLKDIGIYEAILLDKLLVIRGQPTAILRMEDSMKLDELGQAILQEIRRRGLSATLTERTAEVKLAE